jgi:hypothetical protein
MEIDDKLEIQIITISRKIRKLNQYIHQLKSAGAKTSIAESLKLRDELTNEFRKIVALLEEKEVMPY